MPQSELGVSDPAGRGDLPAEEAGARPAGPAGLPEGPAAGLARHVGHGGAEGRQAAVRGAQQERRLQHVGLHGAAAH